MQSLQTESIQCPYCWEQIEVLVDCSIDDQDYIEDCSVCCRPIIFSVLVSEGGAINMGVRAEDD